MRTTQLLAGRDFAARNPAAVSMANFVYLVEDEATKEAVLVDAAWEIAELLEIVQTRGLKLVAALVTHSHPDHAGGRYAGLSIEGVAELSDRTGVPVWVHPLEEAALVAAGVKRSLIQAAEEGAACKLGQGELRFWHTPGHTPGAICIEAGDALLTGDTLFVGECGRVDLPGSNPMAMWESLQKLKGLRPELVVYPGHDYGETPTSTIEREGRENPWMNISRERWAREG